MESGAALRAKAISAFRSSIRYSLSAAMLEYGVLDCACTCARPPSATASTELANPTSLDVLRLIYIVRFHCGSLGRSASVMPPFHLRTVFTVNLRLASKCQTLSPKRTRCCKVTAPTKHFQNVRSFQHPPAFTRKMPGWVQLVYQNEFASK